MPSADAHLWADTYDGYRRGRVRDPGQRVARENRRVARAAPHCRGGAASRRAPRSPMTQAYACYLRARQESWRWQKDAIDHAVQLLRNGLELVGENEPGSTPRWGSRICSTAKPESTSARGPLVATPRPPRGAPSRSSRRRPPGCCCAVGSTTRAPRIQDAVRDLKAAHALDPNDAGHAPAARQLLPDLRPRRRGARPLIEAPASRSTR